MKPSNHKPCQTKHFKHFWHGTGEVVWPLSVTGSFYFRLFFVATSGSAVEPSCRILCGMASRGGDPSRWLECFQQIKQSNHVKHMMFQTFGMDWATGEVSHPVHWLDHFFVDCFFILLPPVAALWNQTAAAASTDSSMARQRCTRQHGTATRRSWRFWWRRAPPWTSWTPAVRSSAIAGHGAAEPPDATPPVLRSFHSAALRSRRRPRGDRPAAAGSEGLRGHQGHHRLGASADVPFLNTVFSHRQSQYYNRYNRYNRYSRCSSTNVACLNDLWHIF